MKLLMAYVKIIDALNTAIGKTVAWLTLGTVITCYINVYFRYALGFGYIWLQELYVWQHAIVFLVGAGYTLMIGGHVRVDILYSKMSARKKAIADIIGTLLFMAPFLTVVIIEAIPYIQFSIRVDEISVQPGGMPMLYVLKSGIAAFAILVGLQGLGIIARSLLVLSGREDYAVVNGGH